jgi:transposase InsO family protein
MPFEETCRMEQRIRMLSDYDSGHWSVTELCSRYGVCRDTFYAWRRRRSSGSADWFVDLSHAPSHCPHRTEDAVAAEIVRLRRHFPHFGPRKLAAMFRRASPGAACPAASTIGDILTRAGLVEATRRLRRPLGQERPFASVAAPNDEWSADFKGWFRTLDRRRVDPLTIADSHTRFLLDVRIVAPTIEGSRPAFAAAFRAYGLPASIRCDNGPPFGSHGAGGLTRLSAWWLKLGVRPNFVHPASPQENGRHERMHRTLKAETSRPAASDGAAQQRRFDEFRVHFNEVRPHEALGQIPPAEQYVRSAREMPERPEEPWYDADHQVRRVRPDGSVKWRGETVFVSAALTGEWVGIAALESNGWVVRFCDLDVGTIGQDGRFRRFAPPRERLRNPAEPTEGKRDGVSGINPVQNVGSQPG